MGQLKYFKEIEEQRGISKRMLIEWRKKGLKAIRLTEGYATTDEWLDEWLLEQVERNLEENRPQVIPRKPIKHKLRPAGQENKVY